MTDLRVDKRGDIGRSVFKELRDIYFETKCASKVRNTTKRGIKNESEQKKLK